MSITICDTHLVRTVRYLSLTFEPVYFGILFSGLFRVLNSIFGSLIGSFLDVSVSIFNSIHPFNILYVKLLLTFNLFITIFNLNYYSSCEGKQEPLHSKNINIMSFAVTN